MQGEHVGLVFRADPVSSNCLHEFYIISPMIFLKRTNPYVKSYDITLINLYYFNDILAPISQ